MFVCIFFSIFKYTFQQKLNILNLQMSSTYAQKLAQLSARIFGEIVLPKNTPNWRVIQRLAQKPIYKMDEFSMDYYPRHQEHDHLFKILRYYGLYRLVRFNFTLSISNFILFFFNLK